MSPVLDFTYWVLLLTILNHPSPIAAAKFVAVKIDQITCPLYDAKLCSQASCNVLRQADGERLLNVSFTLTVDVSDSFMGSVYFRGVRPNGEMPYLRFNMNICDILGTNFDHFLLKMIKTQVQRVSNLPLKCPLKKNVQYYARNLNLGIHALPSYMPQIKYRSTFNLSYHDRLVLGINTEGALVRRTTKGRWGH